MTALCGCTDDSLCWTAEQLWKLKDSEGRSKYNAHRTMALNYAPDNPRGHFQKIEGLSFWANNLSYE